MPITKEQWKEIAFELASAMGQVKLKCDDYDVRLQVERVSARRYVIVPYVDGYLRGKWVLEDCEERRRFMRPVERFFYSAKTRKELLKIYGGSRAKKADREDVNRKYTFYEMHWDSVGALRRHLEKNNKEITLLGVGFGA